MPCLWRRSRQVEHDQLIGDPTAARVSEPILFGAHPGVHERPAADDVGTTCMFSKP
jgi:hypothetical protein